MTALRCAAALVAASSAVAAVSLLSWRAYLNSPRMQSDMPIVSRRRKGKR